MKISYRNLEMVKIIEDGDFMDVSLNISDVQEVKELKIATIFRNQCHNFKDIQIITQPFYDAMLAAGEKLLKTDVLSLEYSGCGTFIVKNERGTWETYCYDFHIKDSEILRCTLFFFQGKRLNKCYVPNDKIRFITNGLPVEHPGTPIQASLNWLFLMFLFTKYAEVETKELPPNSRTKDISCKYINETKSNITVLDSRWFTTLIKSDAFKVRGHFKMQPYGEGLKERKIKWINQYMKEGLTLKARKLNEGLIFPPQLDIL